MTKGGKIVVGVLVLFVVALWWLDVPQTVWWARAQYVTTTENAQKAKVQQAIADALKKVDAAYADIVTTKDVLDRQIASGTLTPQQLADAKAQKDKLDAQQKTLEALKAKPAAGRGGGL